MMTASQVCRLLENRYAKDHYTTAEIQGVNGKARLDFVAIRASWADPDVHGFEVKVSRQDFLQDDKWPAYLDACKQFWFCTAPGIVTKAEIPEQAGWLEATKNGCKLYMRKKAPHRTMTPENQAKLFRQILHRQHFQPWENPEKTRREQIAAFLEEKAERRELGQRVGIAVKETWRAQQAKIEATERQIAGYAAIARFLEERGVKLEAITWAGKGYGAARHLIEKHAPELIRDYPVELDALERAAKLLDAAAKEAAYNIRLATAAVKNACRDTETGE